MDEIVIHVEMSDDISHLGHFAKHPACLSGQFPLRNADMGSPSAWFIADTGEEEEAKGNLLRARQFATGDVFGVHVRAVCHYNGQYYFSGIQKFDSDNMPDIDIVVKNLIKETEGILVKKGCPKDEAHAIALRAIERRQDVQM